MQPDIRDGTDHEVVEVRHDGSVHLGTTVVRAVSEAVGLPVEELEVELNDVVDPDALNHLFADRLDGTPRHGGIVEFEMGDCRVTITGEGLVRARLA